MQDRVVEKFNIAVTDRVMHKLFDEIEPPYLFAFAKVAAAGPRRIGGASPRWCLSCTRQKPALAGAFSRAMWRVIM